MMKEEVIMKLLMMKEEVIMKLLMMKEEVIVKLLMMKLHYLLPKYSNRRGEGRAAIVDIQMVPWALRLEKVEVKPYCCIPEVKGL